MRRPLLLAALVAVVAACGTAPVTVRTRAEPERSSIPTSGVELLPAMSQLDEAAATTSTTAPQAPLQPLPAPQAATTAPKPAASTTPVLPCGGWLAEVTAAFGTAAPAACRVLVCESRGDPWAQNRSGATGLFQLMPTHAGRFEAHGWTWADAQDGDRNIVVAAEIEAEQGWRPWVCKP